MTLREMISMFFNKRKSLRYPAQGMIEIWSIEDPAPRSVQLHDVSLGGLSFDSKIQWEVNSVIAIRVYAGDSFELVGRVAWCRKLQELYRTGVEFLKDGIYREQMIDELCQFEAHKAMLSPF